jgi:hypothetical protein
VIRRIARKLPAVWPALNASPTASFQRVVWDTRTNRPASASIHRLLGCVPHPALPAGAVGHRVTPDMVVFTVDERCLMELFRFAGGDGRQRDRFADRRLA